MTRINVVPVKELTNRHLMAEYREIMRLPGNLRKSLNRKKPFSMDEIPDDYVLGPGHVKFFYDKFSFLKKRFGMLVDELLERNYNINYLDDSIFDVDVKFMGDYRPTKNAIKINRKRILERLS